MNNKTPQTDDLARGNHVVPTEWAEQLERERDEARKLAEAFHQDQVSLLRERDEARESLRILAGLVAYGLGQSGEEWSLEAMRQATTAIQNAKSLEAAK